MRKFTDACMQTSSDVYRRAKARPGKGFEACAVRSNQISLSVGLENPDESLGIDPFGDGSCRRDDPWRDLRTGRTLAGAPTWLLWPGAVRHVQRGNP